MTLNKDLIKRVEKYISEHTGGMTYHEFIDKVLDESAKASKSFNKGLQDFSKSMDLVTKEFSNDISKSNESRVKEEAKNKANLKKIWGD